jgi:Tat protein translocase TatB subunit
MFDVGFWEIVLIFGLGLMILGPERLPRIASQLGRWVARARRTASQLRWQLERELELKDQNRPQYRPPPKSSQIVPPPGPQPSAPGGDETPAETASAPAGDDEPSATAKATRETDTSS